MHWNNHCRLTIRKDTLLWNKHEYQLSTDIFVKNILNLFHDTGLFYIPNQRFPDVFGGAWKDTRALLILSPIEATEVIYTTENLLIKWVFNFPCLIPHAVVQTCSVKKAFLEVSKNSLENTCARVFFLIKRDSGWGFFLWIFWNSNLAFTCIFLWTNYYLIESIHAFYFC